VSIAEGSVFCLPQHLESYAADVFGRLAAADRLRGLAGDPFLTGLAGLIAGG
jgi:cell filamentation protein